MRPERGPVHAVALLVETGESRRRALRSLLEDAGYEARFAATGEQLEQVRTLVKAKYGFMTHITKLLGTIGGIIKRNRTGHQGNLCTSSACCSGQGKPHFSG